MKQSLSLLGAILTLLLLVRTSAASPSHPVAIGSFIQWYLVRDWTDARWQEEFHALKEAGMQYLVFAPCVESKPRTALYPTKLPGYTLPENCPDLVDACLRNAKRAGFRVFLGLNFHENWWKKAGNDPEWLYAQMREGNRVADELYQHYKAKYGATFYGWYWVWEVDNYNFRTQTQCETLAKALDINVRHIKALDAKMPVMLCPFMNYRLGKPEQYRETWEYVFTHTALGKGDIFAPQDCIGAGGLKMENFVEWFAALRKAVNTKPGLLFWSDAETFDESDWSSAPLERLVRQMQGVQPYVDAILTFAYCHYDSPGTVSPAFHRAYRGYVRTGKLSAPTPSPPANLRAQLLPDKHVHLIWNAGAGSQEETGFLLYRDGVRIHRIPPSRPGTSAPLTFTDTLLSSQKRVYTVRAYNVVGILSSGAECTIPVP